MTWKHSPSLPAKKFTAMPSEKINASVLWDHKDALLADFFECGDNESAVIMVHFRGYNRPLIAEGLGYCVTVSSVCMITPAPPILPTTFATGYSINIGKFWTTLPTVLI
jgi:hypothetical protein